MKAQKKFGFSDCLNRSEVGWTAACQTRFAAYRHNTATRWGACVLDCKAATLTPKLWLSLPPTVEQFLLFDCFTVRDVQTHLITRRHIPQDSNSQSHRCENLKTRRFKGSCQFHATAALTELSTMSRCFMQTRTLAHHCEC
jgi:hypothetical protein